MTASSRDTAMQARHEAWRFYADNTERISARGAFRTGWADGQAYLLAEKRRLEARIEEALIVARLLRLKFGAEYTDSLVAALTNEGND